MYLFRFIKFERINKQTCSYLTFISKHDTNLWPK